MPLKSHLCGGCTAAGGPEASKLPIHLQVFGHTIDDLGRHLVAGLILGLHIELSRPDPGQAIQVSFFNLLYYPTPNLLRKFIEERG